MVLDRFPPVFTANSTFVVTVGRPSVYYFTVDASNVTVGVVGGVPIGATLMGVHGMYTFTWTLEGPLNLSLTFSAMDSYNVTSLLSVRVEVCACQNGGNCTLDGLVGVALGQSVVMNCVCSKGGWFPFIPYKEVTVQYCYHDSV